MEPIIVVGAGPAGLMAAIRAGQLQQKVILIEKNPTLGKKLLLSGKGRCNLTNACELEPFLERFSGKGEFLRDAFKKFFNNSLMDFFENRGLKLKVERQLRVFPAADRSASVLLVLKKELAKNKVEVIYNKPVREISVKDKKVSGVYLNDKSFVSCEKLILACGGASYKFTGSNGECFELARKLGHRIVPLRPGLVPIRVKEKYVKDIEGLALKNIRVKFYSGSKQIISEIGELLFTRCGISGPLVLTLSGQVVDLIEKGGPIYADIDLKPALSKEQLDARLLREFKENSAKTIKNTLKNILPLSLIGVFLLRLKIAPDKKVSYVTKEEREKLALLLKEFKLEIAGHEPLEQAMVTRGGVSLKEINPRTMESRLVSGLYFSGEMIDVDADTGGFNLQAAFSTGYLAGESAALS